jgi:chromosome partitioning protein
MSKIRNCSICLSEFSVEFRYQMEERVELDEVGNEQIEFSYFCSQACVEQSYGQNGEGLSRCDACSREFKVELASEVVFISGRRRYACGSECRKELLGRPRDVRHAEPPPAPEAAPTTLPAPPPAAESSPPASMISGPRVLAVFNHKGGTGKTTTAVSVAAGLAAAGRKVLLVDADGQGNVAVSLDLKSERSLYHVLVMGLSVEQAVVNARPNLDVLVSNETLAAAELYLAGRAQRDRVMATRLDRARELYDHVIIDCSPSLSLMNQNALVFADAVLCPVACDYLSLVGVRQVLRTIKHVNRLLSHPVRFWGVLPTFYDARARICQEALSTLRDHFGDRCLEPVSMAIKVKEAPASGKTLFEHAPESRPTQDYQKVVNRLIDDPNDATEAELHAAMVAQSSRGGVALAAG